MASKGHLGDGSYAVRTAIPACGVLPGDGLSVDRDDEERPGILSRSIVGLTPRRLLTALPAGVEPAADRGDNPVVFEVQRRVRAFGWQPGDELHLYRDDLEVPVELYRELSPDKLRRIPRHAVVALRESSDD